MDKVSMSYELHGRIVLCAYDDFLRGVPLQGLIIGVQDDVTVELVAGGHLNHAEAPC